MKKNRELIKSLIMAGDWSVVSIFNSTEAPTKLDWFRNNTSGNWLLK